MGVGVVSDPTVYLSVTLNDLYKSLPLLETMVILLCEVISILVVNLETLILILISVRKYFLILLVLSFRLSK